LAVAVLALGPGQEASGQRPPEAEALLVFWTFNGSRKFVHFSKISKRKEIRYLQKIIGGHETIEGPEAKLGLGFMPPGLKPPLTFGRHDDGREELLLLWGQAQGECQDTVNAFKTISYV